VFEYDYQHFLAHRLLMGLCESEHSEKSMIAKLKTECGYQWTNKLEGMFKDVQLSKDLMLKFKKEVFDTEKNLDIQLDVNVCTTGYWPSRANIPSNLPQEVAVACDKFKRFYLNQHNGHKLDWRLDQGQSELQVQFSPKLKRGLIVTTYQMMIMLVFNSYKTPTYKQILDITGIPRNDIANHLLSLVHPKVAVLAKKPPGNSLEDSHMFRINPSYQNRLLKVSVPLLPPAKNTDKGGNSEEAGPQLQRRHQMDAAVVRIMKARKSMKHAQLVGEVMQQLSARFKAKPPDIKKRIEALIEQEYLERDSKDRGVYNYLA
jgi:cullin 3